MTRNSWARSPWLTLFAIGLGSINPGFAADGVEATAPDDASTTPLPPIVVSPPPSPWLDSDRRLARLAESLPGLGTDQARAATWSEKALEGLGLRGDGVQALSPAEQQRLRDLLDQMEGS